MKVTRIYEGIITKKAQELGIEFKIKHSIKLGRNDVLLQIKRDMPAPKEDSSDEELKAYKEMIKKQNSFAEFVADIVVGNYSNQIKINYPPNL